MERSTESPEAHVSSSAAACGRPRGQRAVVDSASTSVRTRGVHVRRHWTRRQRSSGTAGGDQRRRRRRSARCTLTTGCLVSSASTVQLRFTATTVDCRRRTTSDDCWTPEVVTPPRHMASISSTSRQNFRPDVCSCRRFVQNCVRIARFS